MQNPIPDDLLATYKILLAGFVLACLMIMPTTVIYLNLHWTLPEDFFLSCLSILSNALITFFHELGHAVAGWYYGYVAVPSFDLTHGGGKTYYATRQIVPLAILVDLGVLYLIYFYRDMSVVRNGLILLLLFHLATAYREVHHDVMFLSGPLGETAIGGFMLTRAWLNRAPRGTAERLLNAAFGFVLVLSAGVLGWSLLHDPDVRQVYLEQKGGHGAGDFHKIAARTGLTFETIVRLYLGSAWLALLAPIVLYALRDRLFIARYEE